jgi:hypothetical protein
MGFKVKLLELIKVCFVFRLLFQGAIQNLMGPHAIAS